jgi:hypothetical protein
LKKKLVESKKFCEILEKRSNSESLSTTITNLCRTVGCSESTRLDLIKLVTITGTTKTKAGSSGKNKTKDDIESWQVSEILLRRLLTLFSSDAHRSMNQVMSATVPSVERDSNMVMWHEEDDDDSDHNNEEEDQGPRKKTVAFMLTRALRQVVENHSRLLAYYDGEITEEMVLVPAEIRQSLLYSWLTEPVGDGRNSNSYYQPSSEKMEEKNETSFSLHLHEDDDDEEENDAMNENTHDNSDGGIGGFGRSSTYPNMGNVLIMTEEEKLELYEYKLHGQIAFTLSSSCWPVEEGEEDLDYCNEEEDDNNLEFVLSRSNERTRTIDVVKTDPVMTVESQGLYLLTFAIGDILEPATDSDEKKKKMKKRKRIGRSFWASKKN